MKSNFRLVRISEIDEVVRIRETQRQRMTWPQWDGTYPSHDDFEKDILREHLHGYYIDGKLIGYAAIVPHKEKPFDMQMWNNKNYLTLHRVCVDPSYKNMGIGRKLAEYAASMVETLEWEACWSDTHAKNIGMHMSLLKAGYIKRDSFHWDSDDLNSKRTAYVYINRKKG